MKKKNVSRVSLIVLAALAALLLMTTTAAAVGALEIPWWSTTASGGVAMSGGTYSLAGLAGQPEAGPALSGGSYSLQGGFLQGAATLVNNFLYLPTILH